MEQKLTDKPQTELKNVISPDGIKNKMEIPYSREEKDNIWTVPE